MPICRSKLVRSQFSPRKHQDWWPAPATSFDCQIDSDANQSIFFCNSFSGSANWCIPLYWLLCSMYKMSTVFLIVRPTRFKSFFSLCEQFWSFRAKNMRSPCHLGRSKFLANSPRHLQPLVAAGPWKCVNTRQVSTLDSTKKHRCRLSYQEYYCCMHCTYLSLYSIYNYTSHNSHVRIFHILYTSTSFSQFSSQGSVLIIARPEPKVAARLGPRSTGEISAIRIRQSNFSFISWMNISNDFSSQPQK